MILASGGNAPDVRMAPETAGGDISGQKMIGASA